MELTLPVPAADSILGFVLILARVGGMMAFAPMFSARSVPVRIRAILAVTFSFVLFPIAQQPDGLSSITAVTLVTVLGQEILVGLAIGFAASVVMMAFAVGGAILDLMAGFSFGGVIDPVYGNQSSLIQQLYTLLAGMIFVTTDCDHWVLSAVARSFQRLPVGGTPPATDFADLALTSVTTVFITGLGVVAPVFIALLLTDIAFGLVARAAPQTQIIQVEFPVKIAVGLSIMIVSLPLLVPLFTRTMDQMLGIAVGGG